jgi:ZIP family zinc transporter
MSMLLWVVLVTTVAGVGGTGLGGLIGALFRRDSDRIVSLLLSFAGGVMLAVVCFDLVPNALSPAGSSVSIWLVLLGIAVGYGVVYLLNYWIDKDTNHEIKHIDKSHPKTADDLDELIHADHYEAHRQMNDRHQLFIGGITMAAAIALHNLPEGMVIGAGYASDRTADVMGGAGFLMAFVIGLHNIPEGMAVSVPLIAGGMKRSKAVLITALTGAPTILGALIGYTLGIMGPIMLAMSLSFASGAMLYVVLGELLPEGILMWRSKMPAFATLVGIVTGMVIIYT